MKTKYPPLHLLSIFEAAARHESFKAASEELFITPSAVSHQIKTLEAQLGITLFHRKSRGVSLNPAGDMYLSYIKQGLDSFELGTKKLHQRFSSPVLKISCSTTVASNLIIPQLAAFQNAHPEIELRIETGNHQVDLRQDDVDLGIRIGQGDWPGITSKKLTDIKVAALCSPQFAKDAKLTKPQDVNSLPLIDLSYMENIWQRWADAMGIKLTNDKRILTFNSYDSAIDAATQSLGVALGMTPIDKFNIDRGLLIAPFEEYLPFNRSLYAVFRTADASRHDLNCFINWLKKSPLIDESDSSIE